MSEDIKEILDGFKEILDNPTTTDECYDGRIIEIDRSYDLDLDEIKLLLDYITNLQEELNKLTAESTEWENKFYIEAKKNDKAIARINEGIFSDEGVRCVEDSEELLNILEGSDKE